MDFTARISKFMTRNLITVSPEVKLSAIREIFIHQHIHHIPVVKFRTLAGMISRSDFLQYLMGINVSIDERLIDDVRFDNHTAEEIMTKGIATLESTDGINVAIQLFSENLFNAIPIVDNGELVGILSTLDILKALMTEEKAWIRNTPLVLS